MSEPKKIVPDTCLFCRQRLTRSVQQADYLVARDRDLLVLRRSADFRILYPFLKIVDPLTFFA